MKIEVNIEKKHFFVLLGAIFLLTAAIVVNAYDPPPLDWNNNPATLGHSVNELDWSQLIEKDVRLHSSNSKIGFVLGGNQPQYSIDLPLAGNQIRIGSLVLDPNARLGISGGKIQIVDGSQGANKFLASDANGVGTWTDVKAIPVPNNERLEFPIPSPGQSNPDAIVNLRNGLWIFTVYGVLPNSDCTNEAYELIVNFNGATSSIFIDDHPDGTAPFSISKIVQVNDGQIDLLANSNHVCQPQNQPKIYGVSGFRIGA